MTSAQFETIPIDYVIVNRTERQRSELENIDELAESIRNTGLINPPVVTREHVLVAGERRITAMRELGWTSIPVQYADTLDENELQLIELEENIKRQDLSWQDEVRAMAKYHRVLAHTSGPEWTMENTAEELAVAKGQLSRAITLDNALATEVKGVADAPMISTAYGIAKRHAERGSTQKTADVLKTLGMAPADTTPAPSSIEVPDNGRNIHLINDSALDFFARPTLEKYNFIHCDFPYGINAGDKSGQSAAKSHGTYDDSYEVYETLLNSFTENVDNFAADSAHLMFWFSMDFYAMTKAALEEAGWTVNPFPLVWFKSDNRGILPDSNRGPRRVYETALLASRGDRKVVRAVGNCFPHSATKEYHQAEKPKPMLEHFFRMLVDDSTVMLDPTAGSGNALAVAEDLGAKYACGLEIDEGHYTNALLNLKL